MGGGGKVISRAGQGQDAGAADPAEKPNVSAAGVALQGYSPVSYFETGKAELGRAEYAVSHGGATYHLASSAQREAFRANPGKYVPAFNGWCAFGMAIGKTFPIDPKQFKIVDGRLFLFLRNEKVDALELWNKDDERALATKADRHFKSVVERH